MIVACAASIVGAAEVAPTVEPLASLRATPPGAPLATRLEIVSARLLGARYLLDPAGEGDQGTIDRDPLLPLDRFDCQTYVETVLALALAKTTESVVPTLVALRYRDAKTDFGARLHFPDIDWIPENERRGVIRNITALVAGSHALATARTTITRAAWLRALPNNPTQARNAFLRDSPGALAELERLARAARSESAAIEYIPKAALGDTELLARIPSGALVFIIRPMSSMFGNVGSRQNVAHVGFAIRTREGLMYRHASSTRRMAVVDRPMTEYLAAMGRTKTFAGIAVFEALDSPVMDKAR